MSTARELVLRFGGNPNRLDVEIGNPNGWGWADVVLAARLPDEYDGNPYEYGAYDLIRDEWSAACDAVESDAPGADDTLRGLLDRYAKAFDA